LSFVSIIATVNYVSVMSDGRITGDDNGILDEKHQKVLRLNENLIIAYTGRIEGINIFLHGLGEIKKDDDWTQIASDSYEKLINSPLKRHKMAFVFAGKNQHGEIEFCTFSTFGHPFSTMKSVENNEFCHAILVGPYTRGLDTEDIIRKAITEGKCSRLEQVIELQKQLNDYVATLDSTVNTVKFHGIVVR